MAKASFVWFGQGGDPPPPRYSTVDGADAERVRALLARRLGTASETGEDVERALFARSEFVTSIAEGISVDFAAVLKGRSLQAPKQVLLSWDPMQTFYCVEFHEFLASLPFLFELAVFDLLVLDEELGWGVSPRPRVSGGRERREKQRIAAAVLPESQRRRVSLFERATTREPDQRFAAEVSPNPEPAIAAESTR